MHNAHKEVLKTSGIFEKNTKKKLSTFFSLYVHNPNSTNGWQKVLQQGMFVTVQPKTNNYNRVNITKKSNYKRIIK